MSFWGDPEGIDSPGSVGHGSDITYIDSELAVVYYDHSSETCKFAYLYD